MIKSVIPVLFTLFLLGSIGGCTTEPPGLLKVGHVGHDHHTALYVAALNSALFKENFGLYLKEIRPKALYELIDGSKVICELELHKAGGGSKMPTDMAQGVFDVGFGGVAAVAFFVDKGTPMKIISPLHSKGDMLVVGHDIPAGDWPEFVDYVKNRRSPLKIGFKNPKAIALLIFQSALKDASIPYTYDAREREARVLFINMKGAGHLNPGLENRIIDAYVCNNPYCAIAEEMGIGRAIADLDDLPPGLWKEHPCCMIAAMESVIESKRREVVKFLEIITLATELMNQDPEIAIRSSSEWIGTSIAVEERSIPTSGYLTDPEESWLTGIYTWAHTMEDLGHIKGDLSGKTDDEIHAKLLDLSLIREARQRALKRMQ